MLIRLSSRSFASRRTRSYVPCRSAHPYGHHQLCCASIFKRILVEVSRILHMRTRWRSQRARIHTIHIGMEHTYSDTELNQYTYEQANRTRRQQMTCSHRCFILSAPACTRWALGGGSVGGWPPPREICMRIGRRTRARL